MSEVVKPIDALRVWLEERRANCLRIAKQQTVTLVRNGWLQDAVYFQLALRLLRERDAARPICLFNVPPSTTACGLYEGHTCDHHYIDIISLPQELRNALTQRHEAIEDWLKYQVQERERTT